jgi:hypothetical protein
MQESNGLSRDHQELESALKSLAPASTPIDPVAAAFSAGRRSGSRRARIWQSAAIISLIFSVGTQLLPTRQTTVIHPQSRSPETVALRAEAPEPPAPQTLQALQNAVRDKGLDALPATNLPAIQVITPGNIF